MSMAVPTSSDGSRVGRAPCAALDATRLQCDSPRWVPQMGGSADVMARIERVPGVRYSALTPNLRGYTGLDLATLSVKADFNVGVHTPGTELAYRDDVHRLVEIVKQRG